MQQNIEGATFYNLVEFIHLKEDCTKNCQIASAKELTEILKHHSLKP